MDTLLIGWWLGKWESSDSNQSRVYNCGQHTVLLTGGVSVSAIQLKDFRP